MRKIIINILFENGGIILEDFFVKELSKNLELEGKIIKGGIQKLINKNKLYRLENKYVSLTDFGDKQENMINELLTKSDFTIDTDAPVIEFFGTERVFDGKSFITDGKMVRGAGMRLFRGKEKVYEGKLEALKRFKDDVKQVEQNYECGISINGYTDFKVGDVVEAYEVREKPRKR